MLKHLAHVRAWCQGARRAPAGTTNPSSWAPGPPQRRTTNLIPTGVGILPTGWQALGDLARTRPAPASANLLSPEPIAPKARHRSQVGADGAVLLIDAMRREVLEPPWKGAIL
jgi:hypothetical protein